MSVRILTGDSRSVLASLPSESVNCCVTSPPYFGLRSYLPDGHPDKAKEIGLENSPDAFVAEMVAVFRDVRRVLRKDGTLFLNLGDSYFGGARRADVCDTFGKEPANSQASGCLCGSLCDGCRKAYRIGRFHSDGLHAPTLDASKTSSSLGHTGSPFDRLPTSGLVPPADHSVAATRDLEPVVRLGDGPLPGARGSKTREFSQQRQGDCRQSDQPSECRSCGCSLPDCALVSARMAECSCGTSATALGSGISGKDVSGSAYPHLTTPSLKPKDLIGIPWRVAFALQADGWWLRQDIIWSKPNPMPESVTDRCTKAHEYLFLLTKSERYYFDADAVKQPVAASTEHRAAKGYAVGGNCAPDRQDAGPNRQLISREPRNIRSVWTVATSPFVGAHFATFPPALIEPCIKAGCSAGGTVLDPFGGAGTTGLVADRLGRDAILIELNPAYATMAADRLARDGGMFANVAAE